MKDKEIKIEYTEQKVQLEEQSDFRDLAGIIRTVNFIPNWTPKKLSDCQVIYASGSVYRNYVYDGVSNSWRYSSLT